VVAGQILAMQDWLPAYHWHAPSLSQDTESVHVQGRRVHDSDVAFHMQFDDCCEHASAVCTRHLRSPQDVVLVDHSHSGSLLQPSEVPWR